MVSAYNLRKMLRCVMFFQRFFSLPTDLEASLMAAAHYASACTCGCTDTKERLFLFLRKTTTPSTSANKV